jgi:hypothetical protein
MAIEAAVEKNIGRELTRWSPAPLTAHYFNNYPPPATMLVWRSANKYRCCCCLLVPHF